LTSHQPKSNLLSACTYLIQLCISQKTSSGVLVYVAISTQALKSLQSHLCTTLWCVVYNACTVQVCQNTIVDYPCTTVQHGSWRLQLGIHLSYFTLHQLERTYGFAELGSCLQIFLRNLKGILHDSYWSCC